MRVSLTGVARNAADEIDSLDSCLQCARGAAGDPPSESRQYSYMLRDLIKNVDSVKSGTEPMSEFARFYCFVPDKPITGELLEQIGFKPLEHGQNNHCWELDIDRDEQRLSIWLDDEEGGSDHSCHLHGNNGFGDVDENEKFDEHCLRLPTPKNFAELWILCEALGAKIKVIE